MPSQASKEEYEEALKLEEAKAKKLRRHLKLEEALMVVGNILGIDPEGVDML